MPEAVPLTMGSYEARSIIANAQRCVNLYGERNAEDSPFPFTFYPTPGLTSLWVPAAPVTARCLYTATNGDLYYVLGKSVYYVPQNWAPVLLGLLSTANGIVSMKDNGVTVLVVDGTTSAFQIDLASRVMTPYLDPNFLGADRVDYLDGFFIFNEPNSRAYYTSLLNTTTLDPTYIAAKNGAPDPLVRAVCINRQLWLLGQKTSDIWANAGTPAFPFQAVPGAFVNQGIVAPYSPAAHDKAIFWLGQNSDGQGVVYEGAGYLAKPISTKALEAAFAKYSTITDAVGFVYEQLGHVFYWLNFPTADKTWVCDISQNPPQWAERTWTDGNGLEHRHRAQVAAFAYGRIVCGDWENGTLYSLDPGSTKDFDGPIVCRRGFPHLTGKGRLIEYKQFQAEMETGNGAGNVYLRYSNTRGKSWSDPLQASLGEIGEGLAVPQWRQLGLARDMVFELFWSADAATALNGAYTDYAPVDS